MTKATDAMAEMIQAIEERVAALLHVHEIKNFEKSGNGNTVFEVIFDDDSKLEIETGAS